MINPEGGEKSMKRLSVGLVASLVLLALASVPLFAGAETSVSGYITDSHCKGEGAKDGHKDCALKCAHEKGAKLGVWDAASSKFYTLDDQKKAEEFAGMSVTVKGTVEGETLKVASITKAEKAAEKK
jgi:hypothetical protein